MFWILDKVVVPGALGGGLIRLGNLMNSEILGKPSDADWAFIFTRIDDVPRHPAQLYEAFTYFISFGILYYVYWYTSKRHQLGYISGLFFVLAFGSRIINEFFKESQGGIETAFGNALNTGQLLSIPFVLAGLYLMFSASARQRA